MYLTHCGLSKSKHKLLNSALELFIAKGYFNTSIPDLVKHSGVSTGSIYHAFKDKETIAAALMQALLNQVEAEQKAILEKHATAKSRYFALSGWMIDTAFHYPEVMQFILKARHKEFLPDSPPICSSTPFMNLRNVVQQGIDTGELRKMDLMVAASCSFGGILRLIELGLDGMLENPLPSYYDDITENTWQSIAS